MAEGLVLSLNTQGEVSESERLCFFVYDHVLWSDVSMAALRGSGGDRRHHPQHHSHRRRHHHRAS